MATYLSLEVPEADGVGEASNYAGGWSSVVCLGSVADFDGGTLTLQVSYDSGVRWLTATNVNGDAVTFTAEGIKDIALGGEPQLRVSLSGSSGSTAATLELHYGVSGTRAGGSVLTVPKI